MKVATVILSFSAFLIFTSSITPAAAAKKSREECMQLAEQRGFSDMGGRGGPKRAFVAACMQGKQN